MADIVLVNPRFEVSYWGLEHALPLFRQARELACRRSPPPRCLTRRNTPSRYWTRTSSNRLRPPGAGRPGRGDGMSVQRFRMRENPRRTEAARRFHCGRRPWITVQEDYFGPLADTIFVGEAEETWPRFLDEWGRGSPAPATSRRRRPT